MITKLTRSQAPFFHILDLLSLKSTVLHTITECMGAHMVPQSQRCNQERNAGGCIQLPGFSCNLRSPLG